MASNGELAGGLLARLGQHKKALSLAAGLGALWLIKRRREQRLALLALHPPEKTTAKQKSRERHSGRIDMEFVKRVLYVMRLVRLNGLGSPFPPAAFA